VKAPDEPRSVVTEPGLRLLPDLAPWEYEALKASIRRFGVILPIVRDEFGNVIDGHQRERACRELGLANYPVLTIAGLTDDEKLDHAFVLNQARRRLGRRQMRDLIAAELKRTPDLSSNWLAQILGTTDKTVEAVRQRLIATSEIPKFERLRGKDGKGRRVARIVTHTAGEADLARKALQILGDDAPKKAMNLRVAEKRARRKELGRVAGGVTAVRPGDGDIRLYHCPFQGLEAAAGIERDSVDLILTDPPYDGGFVPQVADLAALAGRILRPGGLLVMYHGHGNLDRVMGLLGEHLSLAWVAASVWDGVANDVHCRQVFSRWKPVLVYSKGRWAPRDWWMDVYKFDVKEKAVHDWQQPLPEVEKLVGDFSRPGDLVVDPCGGGFTTAVACERLGRRCVSCDLDEAAVIRGRERLAQARIDGSIAG
jgi:site-specific DNA-methyltransferase (adenine-specific)